MIVLLKRNWKVENLETRKILIALLKRNCKVENLGKY